MKIACAQMDGRLAATAADVEENYRRAERLIRAAAAQGADVVVLPETWNVGFFPKEDLASLADADGARTRALLGALARELRVNLVGGSVATLREGKLYNTAYVFDRAGEPVYAYDKIHLFSPSGEAEAFTPGETYHTFALDGVTCGLIICYDVRFGELTRALAREGAEVLFVVSQWTKARADHLETLTRARAIENLCFLALCNSCTGENGGGSAVIDPWGGDLARAGEDEEIVCGTLDFDFLREKRRKLPVWRDRRPELYRYD